MDIFFDLKIKIINKSINLYSLKDFEIQCSLLPAPRSCVNYTAAELESQRQIFFRLTKYLSEDYLILICYLLTFYINVLFNLVKKFSVDPAAAGMVRPRWRQFATKMLHIASERYFICLLKKPSKFSRTIYYLFKSSEAIEICVKLKISLWQQNFFEESFQKLLKIKMRFRVKLKKGSQYSGTI